MKKSSNNNKWFVKVRGSYLPNNGKGWLTYIPFLAWLVAVPCIAVTYISNLAIVLLIIIPNWVAAATIMTYIASQKS